VTVQTFYRYAVWLPLIVPGVLTLAARGLGFRPSALPLGEIIVLSGMYGGLPYAVIALWGTWWIDSRPERQIRRRALQAPLWMLIPWALFAAVIGVLARRIDAFAGLAGLGTVIIIPLGYAYVGVVFLLRSALDLDDATTVPPKA